MTYDLGDYVDVKERLRMFYGKHPDGCLQFELVEVREIEGKTVLIGRAYAYRTPDDPRPGIGTAWELVPGTTPYTRGSELMNLETSCWGRAIGSLGIGLDKGVATMQEVMYARARQDGHQAVEQATRELGVYPTPSGKRLARGDDRATPKQVEALEKMVHKIGYETLAELLDADSEPMLGQKVTLEQLTKAQASVIFDAIKAFQAEVRVS